MKMPNQAQDTLISAAWPAVNNSALRTLLLVFVGSALLTLSAKVNVPFYPVPMTMQTFVVLIIGMTFGPQLAISTVGIYLLQGALGLPVFAGTPANGIGWTYIVGPTGGYLAGFLIAAGIVSYLAKKGFGTNFGMTLLAMAVGMIMIYMFGFTWLAGSIGMEKAWAFGVQPFLLADSFKILLAAIIVPTAWKLIRKYSSS